MLPYLPYSELSSSSSRFELRYPSATLNPFPPSLVLARPQSIVVSRSRFIIPDSHHDGESEALSSCAGSWLLTFCPKIGLMTTVGVPSAVLLFSLNLVV